MKKVKGNINWQSTTVLMGNRPFLFCIGEKCLSGRIIEFKQLNAPEEFEIWIDFIEPSYIQENLILGAQFTINEASRVLGYGEIKEIVR